MATLKREDGPWAQARLPVPPTASPATNRPRGALRADFPAEPGDPARLPTTSALQTDAGPEGSSDLPGGTGSRAGKPGQARPRPPPLRRVISGPAAQALSPARALGRSSAPSASLASRRRERRSRAGGAHRKHPRHPPLHRPFLPASPLTLHGPGPGPGPQSRLRAWSQMGRGLGAGHGWPRSGGPAAPVW